MEYEKPKPIIDNDSKVYWESAKNNKLIIQYSKKNNEYYLYSKQLISNIDSDDIEWIEVSGKGTIYSFTEVYVPAGPAFKEEVPYIVASIELEEGARIISNIINVHNKEISIGKKVKVIFCKHSENLTIPKFELKE
tara:strand:- start:17360 stop:17767 length:408 start_codon:yes stop_codon:yes gene_type:complete